MSGTLRKMIIQALRHRTPPPPTPPPPPTLPCRRLWAAPWRDSQWVPLSDKSEGRRFQNEEQVWNEMQRQTRAPPRANNRVLFSEARSHQWWEGGEEWNKHTPWHKSMACAVAYLSSTQTDRQTDGGKSGDKLCFYACSVSHFTVFHTKSLPVLGEWDFAVLMVL